MICEIITIGTELLLGDIVNTNAQYISKKLAELGLDVYYHISVGDNLNRIVDAIKSGFARSDVIITSGGLGPTDDDITKEAVCKALGLSLKLDNQVLDKIKGYFNNLKNKMPSSNEKQALVPECATIIENENGTAPGLIIKKNGKTIILLPGPPSELIPMFDGKVFAYLKSENKETIKSKTLKVIGIGESEAQEILKSIFDSQSNPTIAPYAKEGEVHLRITAKTSDDKVANKLISKLECEIENKLGDNIYGYDDDTLESVIVNKLIEMKKTISIAESCTGGLISSRITNVPGASKAFLNSIVTYSNQSKNMFLNVDNQILDNYGAVSFETAKEMAIGIRKVSSTDIGLSITGIAGPDGGTKDKPVGLVFIAISHNGNVKVFKENFNGNREKIRWRASCRALDIIRRELLLE